MKIVIQCAGKKYAHAGTLQNSRGEWIKFCAHPALAGTPGAFARPDDRVDGKNQSWRDVLVQYNASFLATGANPQGLVSACALYRPPTYAELAKLPVEDVFIMSAGWGLVRGDYLLPSYNITFSKQAPKHSQRAARETDWLDFNHLVGAIKPGEDVHFFGGEDYLRPFCKLIARHRSPRDFVIHHKVDEARVSMRGDFRFCRHEIRDRMWHYKALTDFLGR